MASGFAPVFSAIIGIMLCTSYTKVREPFEDKFGMERRTHRCVNVSGAVTIDSYLVSTQLGGYSEIIRKIASVKYKRSILPADWVIAQTANFVAEYAE